MTDLESKQMTIANNNNAMTTNNTNSNALVARELGEAQAAVMLAKQFPRDELAAFQNIMNSCARPSFANKAVYRYPRGKTTVSGASVVLAREIARCYGNCVSGYRVLSNDDDQIHLQGYAWDQQTNRRVVLEDKFNARIQRKFRTPDGQEETQWVTPDERDLRELVSRRASFLERNALLRLLPADLIEDAMAACTQSEAKTASGEIKADRTGTLKKLVTAYQQFGVSKDMIEDRLEHRLDDASAEEIAELRQIYNSIKDGSATRDEFFTPRAKLIVNLADIKPVAQPETAQ
jgi:hypothetical protein